MDKVDMAAEFEVPPPPPEAPSAPSQTNEPASATPAASRKLIYHATVRVKVADLPQANDLSSEAFGPPPAGSRPTSPAWPSSRSPQLPWRP